MTLDILMEVVGWIGAMLILGGYALLTAGKVTARSVSYQGDECGRRGRASSPIRAGTGPGPRPSLNVIWVGIGAVALIRIFGKRERAVT